MQVHTPVKVHTVVQLVSRDCFLNLDHLAARSAPLVPFRKRGRPAARHALLAIIVTMDSKLSVREEHFLIHLQHLVVKLVPSGIILIPWGQGIACHAK